MSERKQLKLAMGQIAMSADMEENVQKTMEYIKKAKAEDLLFFPEVQWTPFFPQYEKGQLKKYLGKEIKELCLPLEDARIRRLAEAAKKYDLYLSPNLYVEESGKPYDMSLWINPSGKLEGRAGMVHIFSTKQFYELDYYTPYKDGFQVFDTPFGKIGIVICFDRHFPESIRSCARKGAELVIIPTANVKSEPFELFEWELRVAAYQNNVFIAMCNRVGKEGEMEFAGQSLVVDCDGNLLCKADDQEMLLTAELDLGKCAESRKRRPYIELLRTEVI